MISSIPLVSQNPLLHHDLGLAIASMSIPVAISNIYYSIITVIHNKHAIYKLNLITAVLLFVNSVFQLLGCLLSDIPCMARYFVFAISAYISFVSLDTILYLKAKSVRPKPRVVTIIYIIFRLLHLGIWIKLVIDVRTIHIGTGVDSCTSLARNLDMLLYIGLETLIILYLTIIFLTIIYVQYKEAPRKIYSLLLKDGLIFSLSICLFYFFITILKLTNIMGHMDLFSIGWAVSSKLMTEQVWRSHLWRSESHKSPQVTGVDDFNINLTTIDIESTPSVK